jgi:P27 family predicted phage terminase small subunit
MPGPRPLPTNLHVLRGNPSKKPIRPEPQPTRPAEMPDAPSFLVGYACDEWRRVVPELHRLGLLTVLDVAPLAAYCRAYHTWRTAIEALHDMAKRDPVAAGLMVKSGSGGPMQNPLVLTARQAANDMVRYAGEFGMTAAARARIAAGVYNNPSGGKFDGLIA